MKHIHIFAFQRPFWKNKNTFLRVTWNMLNIAHDSKNGINVEELSHTKLVFAV